MEYMLVFIQIIFKRGVFNLKNNLVNVEETIYSIGVDIATASSIVKYIDLSLNDSIDVSKMDVANLTILLKKQINSIKEKFEQLECLFKV